MFVLAGCCLESQPALDDARSHVRDVGDQLVRMYQFIDDTCRDVTQAPALCPELKRRYDETVHSYMKLNEALR